MEEKQKFIKGTAILIIANAISKLLGAVFKIPLTYILKEEGMAVFNTAMGVYITVLTFVISGFPLALARMTAGDYALKNYAGIKKNVRVSTAVFCAFGLAGALVLFFGADFFAYSMKDPKAALAIRVISPSVFFVAWGNVYKSYYQGCINMIPTAVSQIVEAIIKLAAGFFAAYIMKELAVEIKSAGAISGITAGEIIATLILFVMFIPSVGKMPTVGKERKTREVLSLLSRVAVPMMVFSSISSLVGLLDVATIRNGLLKVRFTKESAEGFLLKYSSYTTCFDNLKNDMKLTIDGARWIYGAYSGFAMTLFHLPTGIIGALGTGILPVISGAVAKNDNRLLKNTTDTALKLTTVFALPCSCVLFVSGKEILDLLFHNTASAIMLRQTAPCLIFVCVSQLIMIILHASGNIVQPFLFGISGAVIKLIINIFLIPCAKLNISGAIIGTYVDEIYVAVLCVSALKKRLNVCFDYSECLFKPLAATGIMAAVILLLKQPFNIIFVNDTISLFADLGVGAMVYLLSLSGFGVFEKKSIRLLLHQNSGQ